MRVLSIHQPWAWLIAMSYKDVENRSWRTAYTGELLIHAGTRWRASEIEQQLDGLVALDLLRADTRPDLAVLRAQRGQVIARSRLVACRQSTGHRSHWAVPGGFVFELEGTVPLERPIALTGRLGLFRPPAHVLEQLGRAA